MIMPFLRLVIIYIVVILAAVLFFKRDSVMSMLGMSSGGAEIAATADEPAKIADPVAEPEVEVETEATSAESSTETAPQPDAADAAQPPKYPTNETARTVAPAAPAEPTGTTVATAPTATSGADDIQTRLDEARQAYWNRDLKGAEASYKGLINDAPDNADIKGELGNLYFTQRRMDEAANMYHQAGLQLIKDGNPQQVMGLIGVLQNIAPDKANDLRNRLSQ